MYIVVKNGDSIIPRGINRYGWKHLDDAEEFAAQQLKEEGDIVEICTLNPVTKLYMDIHVEKIEEGAGLAPEDPEVPGEDENQEPVEGENQEPGDNEENNGEPAAGGEEESEEPSPEDETDTNPANE